ncbi:MAG: DUF6982 domain-containing protein [Terriglobales bacterium]
MNPATHKKIVLRLHPAAWLSGYVDPARLRDKGMLELLPPEGPLIRIAREEVQAAYFVADFHPAGLETLIPPRGETPLPGVRVRCRTRGRHMLDGILASDLLAVAEGLDLTPPYTRSSWHRVWVPAAALEQLQVVEVVRAARRRRASAPHGTGQITLFDSAEAHPWVARDEERTHAPR